MNKTATYVLSNVLTGMVFGSALACTIAAPGGGGGGQPACTPANFNPSNPGASGYVKVFTDDFRTAGTSTISCDGSASPPSGFHWYTMWFFGGNFVCGDIQAGSDGINLNSAQTFGVQIMTAAPSNTKPENWVGTVFGKGAYYEATFAFDGPAIAARGYPQWPSFWSMAVEHLASGGAAHWPGKPTGYENFTEDDFFEYDNVGGIPNGWGSALHNWYEYGSLAAANAAGQATPCDKGYLSASGSYCDAVNLNNEGSAYNNTAAFLPGHAAITWNVTTFHTLGHLWVPGEPANGYKGYNQTFFDGVAAEGGPDTAAAGQYHPLAKPGWTVPTPPATIDVDNMQGPGCTATHCPNGTQQVSAVHDLHRFPVIFGTGTNMPFHIQQVSVWQIPGCGTKTTH